MEGAAQQVAQDALRPPHRRPRVRFAPDQRERPANHRAQRNRINNPVAPAQPHLANEAAVVPMPRLAVHEVNFPVSEPLARHCRELFNIEVIGNNLGRPHAHPLSAIERAVAELLILEMAGHRLINDVGGNASRHRNRPNVWSSCPRLTPADHIRRYSDRFQACQHTMQAATADCPCGRAEIVIFIHSIYYVRPHEIVKRMFDFNVDTAYSAHYEFREPIGFLHKCGKDAAEYTYNVEYDGKVTAVAAGNGMAYQHPNPTWLYRGAYETYYQGGWVTLAWSTERVVGLTHITHFRLVRGRVPKNIDLAAIDVLPLGDSMLHSEHYGRVQLRSGSTAQGATTDPTPLTYTQTARVVSFGRLLAFYTTTWGTRPIVIPKVFVAELARRVAWQPRNAETYSSLAAAAKREIKHYNVSAEDAHEAVQHAVPVAFLYGVQQEIANLKPVNKAGPVLKDHLARLKIEFTAPVWMSPRLIAVACAVAGLAGAYYKYVHLPPAVHPAAADLKPPEWLKSLPEQAKNFASQACERVHQLLNAFRWTAVEHYPKSATEIIVPPNVTQQQVKTAIHSNEAWFATVVFAPVWEELIKRAHFRGVRTWWLLPLCETYQKYRAGVPFSTRLAVLCLHAITAHMPLPVGILTHALWNQIAIDAVQYHMRVRAWWPVLALGALASVWLSKRLTRQPQVGHAACALHYVNTCRQAVASAWTYVEEILPFRIRPVDSERTPPPLQPGTHIDLPAMPTLPRPNTWGLRSEGIIVPSAVPCVPASTTQNELISLQTRAWALMPEPVSTVLSDYRGWVFANFDDLFPKWQDCYPIGETPYREWNTRFPPAIQKHHDVALEQIENYGLQKADFTYKMFVKVEKLNKYSLIEDLVDLLKPRAIQGCSYKATVATGPGCHALSKRLGKMWSTKHFITYAYGSTPAELGKKVHDCEWSFKKAVWQDQDGVLYDAHVSSGMNQVELDVADKLGVAEGCVAACRQQVANHGVTKTGITYSGPPGRRKSGTSGTSVFNGLTNGLTTVYVFCRRNKMHVKELQNVFWTCVAGDDNNNVCDVEAKHDPPLQPIVEEDYLPLGFEMEILRGPLPNISFCSALWWPTTVKNKDDLYEEESFCLGPKPGRLFARLGWSDKPVPNQLQYVRGNALGLRDAVQHIPLARELISKYLSLTTKVVARPVQVQDYQLLSRQPQRQASDERVNDFLSQRYDLTLSDFRDIIKLMKGIKSLPAAIEHPALARVCEVDL